MQANSLEDDTRNAPKDVLQLQGPSPEALEDKKNSVWMGGVADCFSTVFFSLLGRQDKASKIVEDDWEVPFEAITDFKYLGAGAQGQVFSGILNGEMVAVKKLRDQSETNIKHLRKLNHENIVRFRGVCTKPPTYCVIMEYCQYGPLFEYLHSGACFAPKQIIKWAKEIANGMAFLHHHKIVHRDLKSPNILIADNLVVKVSDFGTSRVWSDVSEVIMSFTGTVAWMAPEVIRNEPCSERVDVWSYGVVLWELLTQEIPYKNLETPMIMWGVGSNAIRLPIPATCPEGLQLIINQCWTRDPKSRPPFKIIAAQLEVAAQELNSIKADCFRSTQDSWRKEVQDAMETMCARPVLPKSEVSSAQRREELKLARDVRLMYEQQLKHANQLYMEVYAVCLQLSQREKAVVEREKALTLCRCGVRKALNFPPRQTSTSSDGACALAVFADAPHRRRKKIEKVEPIQTAVSLVSELPYGPPVTVPVYIDSDDESDDEISHNNNADPPPLRDTVVESNGNVDLIHHDPQNNGNYLAHLAHV